MYKFLSNFIIKKHIFILYFLQSLVEKKFWWFRFQNKLLFPLNWGKKLDSFCLWRGNFLFCIYMGLTLCFIPFFFKKRGKVFTNTERYWSFRNYKGNEWKYLPPRRIARKITSFINETNYCWKGSCNVSFLFIYDMVYNDIVNTCLQWHCEHMIPCN